MKIVFGFLGVLGILFILNAQVGFSKDESLGDLVKKLTKQVSKLEKRVSALEGKTISKNSETQQIEMAGEWICEVECIYYVSPGSGVRSIKMSGDAIIVRGAIREDTFMEAYHQCNDEYGKDDEVIGHVEHVTVSPDSSEEACHQEY